MQLLQPPVNTGGVAFGNDLRPVPDNLTGRIDEKRGAHHAAEIGDATWRDHPSAIEAHHLMIAVAEQGDPQATTLTKSQMNIGRVRTDTNHHRTKRLKRLYQVGELVGLAIAPRRFVLRIEIQDHPSPCKITQPNPATLVVLEFKIRGLLAR